MILKKLHVLLFFLVSGVLFSQEVCTTGSGSLTDGRYPIRNTQLFLLENNDTILRIEPDETGNFQFSFDPVKGKNYYLAFDSGWYNQTIIFRDSLSENLITQYQFGELQLIKRIVDRFDNSAYYDLRETNVFTNFSIEWLKSVMEEYPNLKISFVQTITKQETTRIAEKRMRKFGKALRNGGYAN